VGVGAGTVLDRASGPAVGDVMNKQSKEVQQYLQRLVKKYKSLLKQHHEMDKESTEPENKGYYSGKVMAYRTVVDDLQFLLDNFPKGKTRNFYLRR
jgi:predicted RNA-binding protein Jag